MTSRARPLLLGLLAGGGLFTFYLTVVTLGSGWDQALRQLRDDGLLLLPLFPLFGTQVGLYTHLRALVRQRAAAVAATTGASGGVSGAAVVACCAHLIPTFLPVVGISALATALGALRTPLLVLALASNLGGLLLVWRALRHAKAAGLGAGAAVPGGASH